MENSTWKIREQRAAMETLVWTRKDQRAQRRIWYEKKKKRSKNRNGEFDMNIEVQKGQWRSLLFYSKQYIHGDL